MPVVNVKPTEQIHPAAIERCRRVVEALYPLQQLLADYLGSPYNSPPPSLFDHVEAMFRQVALDPQISHPVTTWDFLHSCVELARSILADSKAWRQSISSQQIQRIAECCGYQEGLLNPRPALPEKTVRLEDIKTLTKQKVSDEQIAKIYGWRLPDGTWDTAKVWDCREGKVAAPKTVTFSQKIGRAPHLGLIDSLLDIIATEAAIDSETAFATEPVAYDPSSDYVPATDAEMGDANGDVYDEELAGDVDDVNAAFDDGEAEQA